MEYYHWIMAAVALCAFAYCAVRDTPAALGVMVSQVPFWAGVAAWLPQQIIWVDLNMVMSLATAGAFLLLAHVFGGLSWVAVCLIFVGATLWDVYASLFGVSYYLELHEVLHYLALIGLVGRKFLDRVLGDLRTRLLDGEAG